MGQLTANVRVQPNALQGSAIRRVTRVACAIAMMLIAAYQLTGIRRADAAERPAKQDAARTRLAQRQPINVATAPSSPDRSGSSSRRWTEQRVASADLKPLSAVNVDIRTSSGPLPSDRSGMLTIGTVNPLAYARTNSFMVFQWEAPSITHTPLYFEDVPLEHFGQTHSEILQPAISTVRFALDVLLLPYKMSLDPPWERSYNLRTYPRPATLVPVVHQTLPLKLKPALMQVGVIVALLFIIPG